MAEKTIQVADKPTLDAVKNLLEGSLKTNKQEEYIHLGGCFDVNDLAYEYRNVLSITGSGKLYHALSIVDLTSRKTGVKVTVNPGTETEKVIFARRTGHCSGSSLWGGVGVISQDCYLSLQYASNEYVIPSMGTTKIPRIILLNSNDAISDTEIKTDTLSMQLFKNPIEFSSGLKVDVYCNGQYDVIYSLD